MEEKQVVYRRVKGFELALGAASACVPTLFIILMTFASYIATGIYGATAILAGTIISGSRVFDAVTDPIIGILADRLNTKIGRARPLIVIGWGILAMSCLMMYVICPGKDNVLVFALIYVIYIIGYTLFSIGNGVVGPILTNDPKQRPIFNRWQTTYTTILSNMLSIILAATLMPKYNYQMGLPLFRELCYIVIISTGILILLTVIAVTRSGVDVPEFYVGKVKEPVKIKDVLSVLRHNRALQMYIVAAGSDKVALQTASQSAINIMVFGIVIGNYQFMSSISIINMIVTLIIVNFFAARLAGNKGMKKALIAWTSYALAALAAMFTFMSLVNTLQITHVLPLKIAFIALYCLMGATRMSTSCVSGPFIGDIIDYEFYRSGRYMPSIVLSTYTFVDKLISSLSATIVAVSVSLIGYTASMPQASDPLTQPLFRVALFLWLGVPALGYLCTLIAMHWYPLDKETMVKVQKANAETRAANK